MNLLKYFAVSPASEPLTDGDEIRKRYARLRWSVFLSATLGYGLYYVCRLSLNVIKKPIVDAGVLSEAELGIIGSGLFVTYAVGKLTNGFLADRSNIRRFLAAGLLLTAFINLVLGFTTSFAVFLVLWAVNGWAQSMGAAPCVVALSRWFGDRERGTFYGLWSSSHNIGEAITFIATAVIVAAWGWQWGFRGAGLLGLLGFLLVVLFMRDTPQSCGLPSVAHYKGDETPERVAEEGKSVGELQKEVLRNPAIWMLALAQRIHVRFALCREQLGHLLPRSGQGLYESRSQFRDFDQFVCGIVGTVASGWVSDRFFSGRRHLPALIFGLMNVCGLSLFLLGPRDCFWLDAVSMVVFGLAIGALICFLGGLMAVDIASKKASGAALGVVGIASYAGAAVQDVVSGFTIQSGKSVGTADAVANYDFSVVTWFWIGAAILSVLCALAVWGMSKRKE